MVVKGRVYSSLLQAVTWFSATQTGCHWLISYIEQKKFLACGPEFSVEFSAPPEFSGGVTEKYLRTRWARTFDLQIRKQIFYHCAMHCLLVFIMLWHSLCSFLGFSGRFCSYSQPNFPPVSGSYLPGFSGCICSYWQPNFPTVSGSYLLGFSGRICSYWQPNFPAVYLPGFSGLTFSGTRRPGFSGRICCFWPGFSGRICCFSRDFPAVAFLARII